MLVLSRLQNSLSQILEPPELHTAVLLSPSGQLISFVSYPSRSKDEIRVIAGLSGEVWQETQHTGPGMVEGEMGRIVVLPIDEPLETRPGPPPLPEDYQPLMLLVLNATPNVDWETLEVKGTELASKIAIPLAKLREHLTVRKPPPMPVPSAMTSPVRPR
ncbi:hypothetical protein FB45DRAFT_982211 [Roridomyces roridus]|uniref:Uncharacterized protein n=1 Tax=Roridomyces roridus TaxID=1738132 RepID=A0AAD7B0K5_9AGAR|nr:hypothetical protein FB45DRAFT_764922 [Roridomyces roridus]KAJ7610337.1 hypothetical protein FB45DRAFT_982211 [Roridomyces roridus]